MSNYPPGHPTGVVYSAEEGTCENGHTWTFHITYERDTGASWSDDDVCPECGGEPVKTREADEPDSEYDTLEEARGER